MTQSGRWCRVHGFTLVEVLVVCAIVALTLSLVVLKLEPSESRRLNNAAETLSRQLEAARDEAVIGGQAVAFSSDGQGYQFWVADSGRNSWVALNSESISSGQLPAGVELHSVRVNGLFRPLGERLAFSSAGLSESFVLTLSAGTSTLDIYSDALGRIEVRRAP